MSELAAPIRGTDAHVNVVDVAREYVAVAIEERDCVTVAVVARARVTL